MPKEKSINPAQAQRKAEKQKEIKKNKQNIQSQRNEKLARRNPDRVQKQIDELKELENRGPLRPKDKEILAQLERDLRGIRRAREALGDSAPKFASHEGQEGRSRTDGRSEQFERRQNLGKRRRDEEDMNSSDTDPEVRDIPMPRDTPPPIPYTPKRHDAGANIGPDGKRVPHALPSKPAPTIESQAVYSSAPQLRDLTKEALKFVPTTVAQKKKLAQGQGRLLEPEEIEKLENAGYYAAEKAAEQAGMEGELKSANLKAKAQTGDPDEFEEELRRFENEIDHIYPSTEAGNSRQVQLEDVSDDGN
jgi:hypothetical protein